MACASTDFFVVLQLWLLLNATVQACDPPFLYVGAGRVIKSVELSSQNASDVTEPQAHDGRVLAVAVDVEENTLYFSDQVSRTIKRIDLRSSKIEDVASEVGHCEDMAIDWVNKYIYWTDNKNGQIEMSRVNGSDRKLLFDRDVQYPRGITVDPVHGYMFWTDYGDNPKIERATLAGQERTTIIANTIIASLKYPNDVIVDYSSNRIYWVDAGLNVIGTADLKGRNIKISESIGNSHLFALALYNNTLYITNSKMNANSIIVVNKESLGEIRRFTQSMIGSRDLLGLTMFHESRQPTVISNCTHGNGGCSHLCFIVPDGYRCGCPNGTALREDEYSCQEANFTNCRSQPCQNGGTCYFNFQKFADDCTCSKYYAEKDCGLYLGAGAVSVTLEMNVEEWEKEKFQQAIMRGLDDYCKEDTCGTRNDSISKQFCPCFLNNSARLNATQVTVIGQPVASLPNRTKVDFAVILLPVSASKPLVVVNTTLETIIWDRADFISKHLNQIVLVNNLHPSADALCNDVKSAKEEGIAIGIAIGIPFLVAILIVSAVVAVILYRRKRRNLANQLRGNLQADQRENQQRVNNRDGIDGGYEVVPVAEQRVNNRDGIDGGDEVVPQAEQRDNDRDGIDGGDEVVPVAEQRDNDRDGNDGGYEVVPVAEQRVNDRDGNDGGDEVVPQAEQRSNDRDGNDGTYVFDPQAEQRGNRLRGNNGEGNNDRDRIVFNKYFNISQVSFHGANQDIVDNRRREHLDEQRSAAGNKDMSFHQGLGNLNIPGNQHRENCNEQGCEVTYENEVAHENDNQQLDEAYEDMNASRALATSQERSESATARHPTENDDDVSGTYTNPVQCTDDITKNF